MPKQKTQSRSVDAKKVKEFVETLDKLAYEKPAGFAAYMATCMSATTTGIVTGPVTDEDSGKEQ
jgi:Coenzyme PQQ synthesis protein D (PqqD)